MKQACSLHYAYCNKNSPDRSVAAAVRSVEDDHKVLICLPAPLTYGHMDKLRTTPPSLPSRQPLPTPPPPPPPPHPPPSPSLPKTWRPGEGGDGSPYHQAAGQETPADDSVIWSFQVGRGSVRNRRRGASNCGSTSALEGNECEHGGKPPRIKH